MFDRMDGDNGIERLILVLQSLGSHMHDPVRSGDFHGFWIYIDTSHVDAPSSEPLGQVPLTAPYFEHPLPRFQGDQPVELPQMSRIPAVDQGVTA